MTTGQIETVGSALVLYSVVVCVGLCALSMAPPCVHSPYSPAMEQPSWVPWVTFTSFCFGVLLAIVELVRRAERAADRAEAAARQINPEYAVPGVDSDSTVMRAAARWGADVLSAVANGRSGSEAVRRAIPRVALGAVPEDRQWDAGSEVSTDELPAVPVFDPNDWVARASHAVTPIPEVQRRIDEASNRAAWNAAAVGSSGGVFVAGIHSTHAAMIQRPNALPARPSRSPTHE